ncbi:hypothetical protein SCHPADRAFT_162761 [Schizopora paradoxa]|uniref:Uncharacterized protein n=1 Tax=Schizopora paradoxa TaxID=27342 RepID=A0A0H2S0T9_9AGAM|nr:hypothetical protein SCHPADRAFT_162761 [Schizopora paradoxa]
MPSPPPSSISSSIVLVPKPTRRPSAPRTYPRSLRHAKFHPLIPVTTCSTFAAFIISTSDDGRGNRLRCLEVRSLPRELNGGSPGGVDRLCLGLAFVLLHPRPTGHINLRIWILWLLARLVDSFASYPYLANVRSPGLHRSSLRKGRTTRLQLL